MFGESSRGHEYEETTESSNLDQLSAKLVRVAVGFFGYAAGQQPRGAHLRVTSAQRV